MTGNAFIHFIKVFLLLEKPHTQTSPIEREALSKYCTNAMCAVEIGVFEGVNTALIASKINSKGLLYGIDPFFKGKFGICYSKLITKLNLNRAKISKKVTFIEKLSFDAVKDVPDNIDFIFIDGDHSWEGIKKDWKDWSEKVLPGGITALHDTAIPSNIKNYNKLDSVKYFDEIISKDNRFIILEKVDSLHILKKIS